MSNQSNNLHHHRFLYDKIMLQVIEQSTVTFDDNSTSQTVFSVKPTQPINKNNITFRSLKNYLHC